MGAKLLFLEPQRHMQMEITLVTVGGRREGALCWEDLEGEDAINHAQEKDPALVPWVSELLAIVFMHLRCFLHLFFPYAFVEPEASSSLASDPLHLGHHGPSQGRGAHAAELLGSD